MTNSRGPRKTMRHVLTRAALVILLIGINLQDSIRCQNENVTIQDGNSTIVRFPNSESADVINVTSTTGEDKRQVALKQPERITVVAPKYLLPHSDYFVLLTLANSRVPATVDLQLTGGRDSNREQTEARSVLVDSNETQTVKFAIGDWPAAEYFLSVNAQAVDRSWQFQQEAPVLFHQKSFSGHIQTDKAIYKPGETVQFRVLFLTENLAPLSLKEAINVTVSDPARNIVRQWTGQSNYRGLFSLEMPLSDDPMLGDWTIQVEAKGQQFDKQFTIAEYILPTFDVQIRLPPYATYNDSKIVASVKAEYTYGKPVKGHVTLAVQPLVRFRRISTPPLEQAQYRSRLQNGRADIEIEIMKSRDLFERNVEFFALVEEDLTGRKYNRTATLKLYENSIKIERLRADRETFKPGLSHLMQYKVAYQDDTPVSDHGQQVELEYSFMGETISVVKLRPQGGIIQHELEVPHKVKRPAPLWIGRPTERAKSEQEAVPSWIDIKARYLDQTHHLGAMSGFRSASGQYIQISLPQVLQRPSGARQSTGQVRLGDQLKVRVKSTERMQQINCHCMSRGKIVWALSPNGKNSSELEFEVQVDQRMAPESQIICFYVRPENKELIADLATIQVGGFIRNFVKLSPSRTEAKPGQELEVDVFTKPQSLVGVLAIDQSVLLLKTGNDISTEQVLKDNDKFAGENVNYGIAGDSSDLFESANLIIITNNLLEKTYENLYPISFLSMKSVSLSSEILDRASVPSPSLQYTSSRLTDTSASNPIVIRSLFPETWLWQNGTADTDGKLNFKAKIPDSITTWQLSAFSLSEAHGLGLAPGSDGRNPTTIRVFRPFFIKMNLPYSIIRGETVSIQAIVFNHSKRPTAAKVTLDNSRQEFEFVEAANSVEDEKQSNSTSESRLIRLSANDGASVSFLIKPLKLGHIDIKVIAQGELAGDGVIRKLLVKPEGQTQHFNRAMLIRLPRSAGSGENSSIFEKNITIDVPANAVKDSKKVYVSAIGDILGAGLANVDDLLRLPTGCGEQNMINLVPNIVIYNYLMSARRLRDVQKARAVKNIQVGYQRQLNYKRQDGSFSAFGPSDTNGSVWLTAYVLKTLQQARKIITVDPNVIREAASFVMSFARSDGSFEEVGMLHNKALASEAQAQGSSIYLTAYALSSLLEAPLPNIDSGDKPGKEMLDKGLDFLERQLDKTDDSYELAIIAHTLQLAGRRDAADKAYDKLWARANENNDQVWWSPSSKGLNAGEATSGKLRSSNPEEIESIAGGSEDESFSKKKSPSSTVPPLKPLAVTSKQSAHLFVPDSLAIEASSLALLTAVQRGDLERGLPIVRWLIGQQNSQGGFASTQDTVLAIEALAAFAQANGDRSNEQSAKTIDVEFLTPRVKRSQFRGSNVLDLSISQSNALVKQQVQLDDNTTWVQVRATGSGVAIVQVSWKYNLLVSAEEPTFYLNPMLDKSSTSNYLQLSICTFYKAGEASNMAVAEIELPSGYVADAEALPSLKRHKSIKRIETQDGETKVIIYIDRVLKNEELCFTVPAHRSTKVSNNKPVPVTIYDYYDPKKAARIFYEPKPVSSCDICEQDTCSEQCQTKEKRPEKLISLHEQRRTSAQLVASNNKTLTKDGPQTHSNLRETRQKSNLTLPLAEDLLPFKPVLQSLRRVL